jgi:Ca2+-binding EF-hand superfamily protein
MIETLFKKKTDDDEISRLFKNFDTNKNGEITLQGNYLILYWTIFVKYFKKK